VVINGVERALDGATPAELHLSWMVSMQERGWRWGAVKDPQQRTHPNLLPYSELPPAEREKDSLFKAIVEWAKNT
jgi:RyR domain-containing protein